MFKKLKSIHSPYAVLISGLVVIALLTSWAGIWHYHYELSHSKNIGGHTTTQATRPSGQAAAGQLLTVPDQVSGAPESASPKAKSSTSKSASANAGQPAIATPTANPAASQSQTLSISLIINSQFVGTVNLSAGANQCDVLSRALAQGVLSDLNMRYSKDYGTYGVYVINGQGDPNTIWWTYKVNGVAPPYGCAYITAHQGDQVNWQYQRK